MKPIRAFKWIAAALAVFVVSSAGQALAQQTLEKVKDRGTLRCGVNTGLAGFSAPDEQGNWDGFDVDFCRAVAVAIFNDPKAVEFIPLTAKERFTALQSAEIDVLARNTTWTFNRDVKLGMNFVGVNYYDGQGFMVPKDLGVDSALQLDGAAVCVLTGTTTEKNLADYFRANGMDYTPVVFEKYDELREAYVAGRCDAWTTDSSGLAAQKTTLPDPKAHVILPEIISKEPLGPVVREGDEPWSDVVQWTLHALIVAEELGVNSKNVDDMRQSKNPEIRRLLGIEGKFGQQLGLSKGWSYNIIKKIGNYGEVFARHIGVNTDLGLQRGLNQLWTKGGILYAPPFR